eukprot:TRINITY_DN48922_c0_g1_i1.p1 TRINITY_DN48922_c0_g1~~TRINITY_DN48922_c0_g1_i1.p1  ORF type:complete len:766 (-),score=96.15 TRINITY_DN48922_c0_g1_i1:155-2452(-)
MDSHCVQTKEQIAQCFFHLQSMCSPFVDSVYPLQDNLRKVASKLNLLTPTLHIGIIGNDKAGKSTLINALSGCDMLPALPANGRLEVRHRLCAEPVLLSQSQKQSLAMEAEGVKTYLTRNWEVGTFLQLDVTFPCFGKDQHLAELPPVFIEYPAGTKLSKCIRLSKTSYQCTEWSVLCDVVIYVIDYGLLKTDKEKTIFDDLLDPVNPSIVSNMTERMFFVVNRIDPLIAAETKTTNIHQPEDHTKFKDKEDLRHYVAMLINNTVGFRPQPVQIAVTSALNGLYSRIVQSRIHPPTVKQLYDFAEMVRGSGYMQTIDDLTDEDLQLECRGHSYTSEIESGIQEVEAQLVIIAANRGRFMVASCLVEAIHYSQQYASVLEQAIPLLAEESQHKAEVQKALQEEYEYIDGQLQRAEDLLHSVVPDMHTIFYNSFEDFWFQRIGEIQAVFDGKGEMYFKSRQATSIYEIQRELKRYRAFLPRYERDRVYLEKKLEEEKERIKQAKKNGEDSVQSPTSPEQGNEALFVNNHTASILKVLEKERYELAVSFCVVVSHHLKDELEVLLPSLEVQLMDRRNQLLDGFQRESANMIHQAEKSSSKLFGMSAFLNTIHDMEILKRDLRALNNVIRGVPEHVADIFATLETTPDSDSQEGALLKAWRIFANQANPYDFIMFDEEGLYEVMDNAVAHLQGSVGSYQTSLDKGVQQEGEDITTNTTVGGEVEQQRHQLPQQHELLVSMHQELLARNVFSVDVIEVVQQQEKVMTGEA